MKAIPKEMRAIVTYGPHDYRFEQIPVPEITEGELLLEVEACGICAGDIKAYMGAENFWGSPGKPAAAPLTTPTVGGHEILGRVVKITEKAARDKGVQVGDRLVVEQIVPCGKCRYCKQGRYSLCVDHAVYGFQNDLYGGFAEYTRIPENGIVYKVPDDMPMKTAVLAEPYGCSWHCIERANIQPEDVVVISGCGTLGLGMMTAARKKNPAKLIAVDLFDDRLATAKEFGADITINAAEVNAAEEIKKLTDGYGCDTYIEATGHISSVTQGLAAIRKNGNFIEFSVFKDKVTCDWTIIGDGKELNIYGVSLSPYSFPHVIEGFKDGSLKTDGVVSHTFPLEQFKEAFELCIEGKNCKKVVLIP